jgi:sucrose-6-phosphate hydrolase SacC (GH32 family)
LTSIASAEKCQTAEAPLDDLATAANNSYFLKWRPTFHFQAPNSWMNGTLIETGTLTLRS